MQKRRIPLVFLLTLVLLFAAGCDLLTTIRGGSDGGDPVVVSVDFATDTTLQGYTSYTTANVPTAAGAVNILFTTTAHAKGFQFFKVTYEEQGGDFVFVKGAVLYSTEELKPEKPLVIGMEFAGAIPSRGISYTDENGETKSFVVSISGNDGSVILAKF
ncbi:MAG: hypothetical protein FWD43_01335 [Coriobacteriia bacterium]|nr:hypothetical protein [Coriobacteriia bacterium]